MRARQLRADSGVTTNAGGRVTHWADRSGNTNDFAQGTDAHRPSLSGPAVAGRPAVTFDGSDDSLARVADNGSLDFTSGFLVAVFRAGVTQPGYHGISIRHWGFGFFVMDDRLTAYDWTISASHSFGPEIDDGSPHSLGFEFDSGAANGARLFFDGSASGPFTYSAMVGGPGVIGAGNQEGQCQLLAGDLAELIWYDRKLSPEELAAVRAYLVARHSPGDRDWDGLPDAWEIAHGLDPDHWDSDGNGVPDGIDDGDGDGIPTAEERDRGTDPRSADGGPALRYALIDLGTNGEAIAMSPSGEWIVGRLNGADGRAFRWHGGQMAVFPTNGFAVAVNDSGAAAINRGIDDLGGEAGATWTEVLRWNTGGGIEVLNADMDPRDYGGNPGPEPEFGFGACDIAWDGTVCGAATTTCIDSWVEPSPPEMVAPYSYTDGGRVWPCQWAGSGTEHLKAPGGSAVPRPYSWPDEIPDWQGLANRINRYGRMAGHVYIDRWPPLSPVVRWDVNGACTEVPYSDMEWVVDLNDADELLLGTGPGFRLLDADNSGLFSATNATAEGCNNLGDIAGYHGPWNHLERSAWFSTTNGPSGARRWERRSLTNLLPAATLENWSVNGPVAIGDNRAIAANATRLSDGHGRPVLLLPIDIAVDANRDGTVKFAGNVDSTQGKPYDKTEEAKPFPFWCNDDHDTEDDDSEGESLSGAADSADGEIKSKRDLEDFTRLNVYIGGLHQAIVGGQIKVGLKWKSTSSGSPSIKMWRNLSPDGGNEYLTDDTVAGQHLSLSNPGQVQGSTAYIIPTQYWVDVGLSETQPNGYLLFEAVTEGKGELVISLHKSDGTEIGEGPGVWLDLLNVKKMYQRGKAQPEGIAAPQDQLNESGVFTGPVSVVADENGQPFSADANEEKKAVIFVHGWSMDYPSSISFSETMFKRLYHQGFKGRFCMFRWDPIIVNKVWDLEASNGEYNRSEHRAWVYGDALRSFAQSLKNDGFAVTLVGHSMGNIVCGSALRDGLAVDAYLLMEAAVPAGCFDESGGSGVGGVNGYGRFWTDEGSEPTPDYYQDPNGELTKGYRGFLKGIGSNAGRVVNFHNRRDFALATGYKYLVFEANWEMNQSSYKPDGGPFPAYDWYYKYYPDPPNIDERATLEFYLFAGRYVNHPWERMSFVARPRSKAVGAVQGTSDNPTPGGAITENVDLESLYGFDNRAGDHSGHFNRRIQEVDELYLRVKEIVQPAPAP